MQSARGIVRAAVERQSSLLNVPAAPPSSLGAGIYFSLIMPLPLLIQGPFLDAAPSDKASADVPDHGWLDPETAAAAAAQWDVPPSSSHACPGCAFPAPPPKLCRAISQGLFYRFFRVLVFTDLALILLVESITPKVNFRFY